MKKEKRNAIIKAVVVAIDGVDTIVPWDKVNLSHWEAECETCGSHGEVKIELLGTEFNDVHQVPLEVW
jgi:hypothetical protein